MAARIEAACDQSNLWHSLQMDLMFSDLALFPLHFSIIIIITPHSGRPWVGVVVFDKAWFCFCFLWLHSSHRQRSIEAFFHHAWSCVALRYCLLFALRALPRRTHLVLLSSPHLSIARLSDIGHEGPAVSGKGGDEIRTDRKLRERLNKAPGV